VACFWEQRVARPRVQRVLPDGHADLLFHASGEVEIAGVADAVALPELPAGTAIRGVRLRPEAIGAALRTSASTLRNLTLPAEDVLGARTARRLRDPRYLDRWVRAIQPDRRVRAALHLLGAQPVEDVAASLAVSSRQVRRVLLEHVGISPKAFQQVLRLQRFVQVAERGAPLAAAASEAGYADQSHLSRETRRFTGLTPADLMRQRRTQR
jgi:AraC-like DNA-binding protein